MDLQRVKSSNIEAVGHEGETLVVRFKGGVTYEYEGVEPDVAAALLGAKSVGATFAQLVRKGGYAFRRLPPDEAKAHLLAPEQAGEEAP